MKKAVVIVKKFLDSNKEARVDAYAAQAAFYIIMGAIPFLMLLLILLQYTPMTKEDLLNVLAEILPGVFRSYLADLVNGIYVTNTALLSGTAIAALWASGRTAMAISNGLNSVCGILDRRNYVVSRLRAAWYMFLLLLCLVMALGLLVFGNIVHGWFIGKVPVMEQFSDLIIWMRTGGVLVALTILLSAMYAYMPNITRPFWTQLPGASGAAISWAVLSYVISIYMTWGQKSAIYGSLTAVVMIMLWLYFCMWILFAGAQANRMLEEQRMEKKRKYQMEEEE